MSISSSRLGGNLRGVHPRHGKRLAARAHLRLHPRERHRAGLRDGPGLRGEGAFQSWASMMKPDAGRKIMDAAGQRMKRPKVG